MSRVLDVLDAESVGDGDCAGMYVERGAPAILFSSLCRLCRGQLTIKLIKLRVCWTLLDLWAVVYFLGPVAVETSAPDRHCWFCFWDLMSSHYGAPRNCTSK